MLALLLVCGCLAPMDPAAADIAMVRVTVGNAGFTADTIQVRATTKVHAVALAEAGYDLGLTDFRYTSSDPAVAEVDANGTVRGIRPGSAVITATAPRGGRSATVTVLVVPSTIAYTIAVGPSPGALAFSSDYTRAYVATAGDSIVVLDALGFFRVAAVDVDAPSRALATSGSTLYATHFALDSIGQVATASSARIGRSHFGAGPAGAVTADGRVFIAAAFDRRLVVIHPDQSSTFVPLPGEPYELAAAQAAHLVAATVRSGGEWRVALVSSQTGDTTVTFGVAPGPTGIALSATGDAVYVLYRDEQLLRVYQRGAAGWGMTGSLPTGANPGGVAARHVGRVPYVVISGAPTLVIDGATLAVYDSIENAGTGPVAIRPDGLFAFISASGAGAVHVIGL
jgi:DNA-binding beta-propeller fold protein YncE